MARFVDFLIADWNAANAGARGFHSTLKIGNQHTTTSSHTHCTEGPRCSISRTWRTA
jgi:hypothetical protein